MAIGFNPFDDYKRPSEERPWVEAERMRREARLADTRTYYRPEFSYRKLDANEINDYEQSVMLSPRRLTPYQVIICEELSISAVSADVPGEPTKVEVRIVEMSRPPAPNMRRTDRITADRWVQFAAAEAQNHAAICKPSGCTCPNCGEYQRLRRRALDLMDGGHVERLTEAWHMALDEMTGGEDPLKSGPRFAQATPSVSVSKPIVVNTPSIKDRSWVQKRFGVIDV